MVSSNGLVICDEEREIRDEFVLMVELKHKLIPYYNSNDKLHFITLNFYNYV